MDYNVEILQRLTRLETKLDQLPELKTEIHALRESMVGLRIRVAGASASIALLVSGLGFILGKLLA